MKMAFCTRLWITAATTLTDTTLTRGKNVFTNKIDTAIAIMPAGRLYISVDKLPVIRQPKTVRSMTKTNASHHPKTSKVNRPKILLSPIFALGKNNGGKRFSIANVTKAIAVKTPKYAIFLAEKLFINLPHIRLVVRVANAIYRQSVRNANNNVASVSNRRKFCAVVMKRAGRFRHYGCFFFF